MLQQLDQKRPTFSPITTDDVSVEAVSWVLEIGRLLFSVLTDEEKAELIRLLSTSSGENELGNAGVT